MPLSCWVPNVIITKDRVTLIVDSITEAHFIVSICNFRTGQCSVPECYLHCPDQM